jgi:hypothetical protein
MITMAQMRYKEVEVASLSFVFVMAFFQDVKVTMA